MNEYGVPTIVLIIGAILGTGGVVGLLRARSQNRLNNAQADVTLGEGWNVLVTEYRREINELRERLAVVEKQEAQCRDRLSALESGSHAAAVEKQLRTAIDKELEKRGPRR